MGVQGDMLKPNLNLALCVRKRLRRNGFGGCAFKGGRNIIAAAAGCKRLGVQL